MEFLLTFIGIIIGGIILIFVLYQVIKATIHIVPEERRLVVYRLGRFSRIAGPGIVPVIPWLEHVVRILEVRDHPMEVTVPGIFAYGVPNDLTLNLWCSFDLVRAAANNRHKLASLAHLSDAERRQQIEVKMREALVNQIAELQKRKPLPEGATPLDGVIALAPDTDRYNDLMSGLKSELANTLPPVGVILNTSHSITVTRRNIPDVIIDAIKRTQGRQIDSQWLTKYANQLREQFPEISNAVLDQMVASIEGVDVGSIQRLRLDQDESTEAEFELEIPIDSTATPNIFAKPKFRPNFRNPYIAGPPIIDPKMFYGRQSDLEKINGLLKGNFVMLIGQRRIGKTSLLYQLKFYLSQLKNTPENFVPVLVSVEGTPEVEFFHTLMEEIVNAIQEYISREVITNLSFDLSSPIYRYRTFYRDLQTVLKCLRSTVPKPTHLVLLLDEMDTLNSYNQETQSQLRRNFQYFTNTNLSVVVAGVNLQRQWSGESSPFYNMFNPVILNSFPETEARRLITEPVRDIYEYSDEAISRILEATLGLPHRIQQLCLETINHLLINSKGSGKVTVEDVDTVLQSINWLDESEKHIDMNELEREIEIAQGIQETFLPQFVPEVHSLQMAGRILRARQIGGDFFYFFSMGNDQLGIVIGDVDGKGIPAALFVTATITAIETQIRVDLGPGELLNKLNHMLYSRLQGNKMDIGLQIATFFPLPSSMDNSGKTNEESKSVLMTVSNAGMIPAIIATKQSYLPLPVISKPIGQLSPTEQSYHDEAFLLDPSSIVIFTTDGIVEAKSETHEVFGPERLKDTITEVIDTLDAETIAEHVIKTVQKFIGQTERNYDMSVVVIVAN